MVMGKENGIGTSTQMFTTEQGLYSKGAEIIAHKKIKNFKEG